MRAIRETNTRVFGETVMNSAGVICEGLLALLPPLRAQPVARSGPRVSQLQAVRRRRVYQQRRIIERRYAADPEQQMVQRTEFERMKDNDKYLMSLVDPTRYAQYSEPPEINSGELNIDGLPQELRAARDQLTDCFYDAPDRPTALLYRRESNERVLLALNEFEAAANELLRLIDASPEGITEQVKAQYEAQVNASANRARSLIHEEFQLSALRIDYEDNVNIGGFYHDWHQRKVTAGLVRVLENLHNSPTLAERPAEVN